MSKMDTEVIATAAFKLAISKTDLLSPFVNEKDKEPSWDGHIYIYSDKRKTKENIKRVPVQVKGEAVNRRKVKEHITHDIDYDDLMAYLSDGGAIYVVVYIDETTGEPLQIKDLSEIGMLQIGSFIGGNILTYEAQDMVYDDAYTGSSGAFNGLSSALRNFGTAELFTVEVVATGQYSTFTGSCTFSCDASGFQILVESVGGLGNLVF